MPKRKTTFKQRIRKNAMKERHEVAKDIQKRMRVTGRKHNRYDGIDSGGRSMEEIVDEVAHGGAIAARDETLDARSLANLLVRVDPTTGRKKIVDQLDPSDPAALPEMKLDDIAANSSAADNQGNNKNRYKHRGSPYVFWENVGLHPLLLEALKTMKFTHPTPVQEEVLPTVLNFGSEESAKRKSGSKKMPPGLLKEDMVVSAETGSGKTLVFALPILHHILLQIEADEEEAMSNKTASKETVATAGVAEATQDKKRRKLESSSGKKASRKAAAAAAEELPEEPATVPPPIVSTQPKGNRIMHSLIVSPTRELAMQIKASMEQLCQHARHLIRIGCVVGGMAPEKQQRVLNRHPHVLICTPGRLWDLIQKNEGCYLGHSISRRLRFVILDEADKLLQSGRFEELKQILERIHCDILPAGHGQRTRDENDVEHLAIDEDVVSEDGEGMESGKWDDEKQKFIPYTAEEKEQMKSKSKKVGESNADSFPTHGVGKDRPRYIPLPPPPADKHRVTTFVTSATLSLQTNYQRKDFKSNKSIIRTSNANTMNAVLTELGIRQKHAKIFNMSPDAGVVAKINETFLRCPDNSKDLYLYYFLRTYKERTIIFVNAISMLRRLTHILEILGVPVVGLHASMQQRQRIKFVERFKTGEKRVLVATDIASRGIDIEGLRYVVHYQVPRSTDAYIHRCGRTARCGGTGLSVLMVNATEYVSFKKLLESLGRTEGTMETFSLEPSVVHHLHPHLTVALQIDKLQREVGKVNADNRWVTRMSNETEIEAEDMLKDDKAKDNNEKLKVIKVLKKRLDAMTRKDMGHFGGKGAFRSGAKAIGALEARQKLRDRADRQVIKGAKF